MVAGCVCLHFWSLVDCVYECDMVLVRWCFHHFLNFLSQILLFLSLKFSVVFCFSEYSPFNLVFDDLLIDEIALISVLCGLFYLFLCFEIPNCFIHCCIKLLG